MPTADVIWKALLTWHVLGALAAVAMTTLCIFPILAFTRRGWLIKRQEVMSGLKPSAKARYIGTFLADQKGDPETAFERMYAHRYGRYRLIVPTILLAAILLAATLLVSDTAFSRLAVTTGGHVYDKTYAMTLPGRAVAAIMGAYVWIAFALINGAAVYNLPPPLVLSSALRLLVAAPLGYALGGVANPGTGTFLAFAIGAFPLQTVQTVLQRLANKQFGLEIGSDGRPDQVAKVDGVDPPTADLLQLADITTTAQLAYCDPVQVSLRINKRFDAVIDLVDQALARIYLGDKLDKLMPFGLRGATEIGNLLDDLAKPETEQGKIAQAALKAAAVVVAVPEEGLLRAFSEIARDPYAEFLRDVWSG